MYSVTSKRINHGVLLDSGMELAPGREWKVSGQNPGPPFHGETLVVKRYTTGFVVKSLRVGVNMMHGFPILCEAAHWPGMTVKDRPALLGELVPVAPVVYPFWYVEVILVNEGTAARQFVAMLQGPVIR